MPTEVEAKFRAESEGPLIELAARPRLGHALLGAARTVDEVDRYLDTDDGGLAAARWACRLRSREGATRISLKGLPTGAVAGWEHRRREVEGPATDTIEPGDWPASPALELLTRLRDGRDLVERLRLYQARTERAVTLPGGASVGTLTLDRVRMTAAGADLGRLFMVELELDASSDAAEDELEGLAAELETTDGLVAEPRSKLEHALERLAAPMSRPDPAAWARARTPMDWLALGAAVAVFGYVGWDSALWDARLQLLLHLIAIGAIAGLGVVALRGGELPRTPLDLPLLGLLAALALATASALNVGMSLRAMAVIVAYWAMLPVALLAVRHRPAWVGLVTSVPVLLLAIPTLLAMVVRRVEWIVVGAPGLPPLRLPVEGTPFGSVAVPPFVLIPAWALAGLIEPPALRRVVRTGLLAVGVPLVILSGSRSAWLAIAAGLAVGLAPWAWRQRRRLGRPRGLSVRGLLVGAGVLLAGGVGLVLVLPRLTAVSSLLYRGALWRDTLAAWSSDPLLGIGPGFMPYARQAAAADFSFPVRQPHSHDLPLGVLGDAGIVGLIAGLLVVVTLAVCAGPWRSRTPVGRTAAVVLVGLGIGGLFEDLTFLPGFNLLAIALVAVALLDAGAVTWAPLRLAPPFRRLALLAGTGAIGVVLIAAMVIADAGAIAYRSGITAADSANWPGSTSWLQRAVEIDPWHPAGPQALSVAADAAGQPTLALDAARRATQLNPGDATAWTNLALLCEADGDVPCTLEAAERAVAKARYLAPELFNAAFVLDRLGETDAADAAYRLSLLTQPATSFVAEWPRRVVIGDGRIPDVTDPSWQLNLLLARHSTGEPIEPGEFADPAVRALAHAAIGEREEAEQWLARAFEEHPDEARTHDIGVILRGAWGEPIEDAVRIASVVRGRPFPDRDPPIEIPRSVLDIASFRAYPRDGFVGTAVRMATRPPFPWTLQQILP